eukprot:2417475-Pleurochrysis_carterae.AAC.1
MVKAEKGKLRKVAVSSATSRAKLSSVWIARPPFSLIARPCSRVSSRMSDKNCESGGGGIGDVEDIAAAVRVVQQ